MNTSQGAIAPQIQRAVPRPATGLTEAQASVLMVLQDGWTTRDVAELIGRQPGKESNRQHSAFVQEILGELQALGRIRHAYGSNRNRPGPIRWIKT